jgi:hypothetical protein
LRAIQDGPKTIEPQALFQVQLNHSLTNPIMTSVGPKTTNTNKIKDFYCGSRILILIHAQSPVTKPLLHMVFGYIGSFAYVGKPLSRTYVMKKKEKKEGKSNKKDTNL